MAELKPCPFCGKTNIFVCKEDGEYQVVCDFSQDGCGASSGFRESMKEAVEAWNRRDDNGCEYIRLDTTIMGIDGLINEAPTGSQARTLLCAKDMIYDQQWYSQRMNPAKRGEWIDKVIIPIENFELKGLNIIRARCTACLIFSSDVTSKAEMTLPYCPNCGANMRKEG